MIYIYFSKDGLGLNTISNIIEAIEKQMQGWISKGFDIKIDHYKKVILDLTFVGIEGKLAIYDEVLMTFSLASIDNTYYCLYMDNAIGLIKDQKKKHFISIHDNNEPFFMNLQLNLIDSLKKIRIRMFYIEFNDHLKAFDYFEKFALKI